MNETEKMQNLHQLAVKGEILSVQEQSALQNWYDVSDREEELILNDSQPVQNIKDLRQQLIATTKQTVKISREVEFLISQNEILRNENQSLRKTLEERLLEKAA